MARYSFYILARRWLPSSRFGTVSRVVAHVAAQENEQHCAAFRRRPPMTNELSLGRAVVQGDDMFCLGEKEPALDQHAGHCHARREEQGEDGRQPRERDRHER